MNKYEKMMQELKEEFDEEFADYSTELDRLNRIANAACHKYNDQIHAINSLRQNLQDEIAALYKFLRRFGEMGKKISPFEYVTEDSRFVENKQATGSLHQNPDNNRTSGFVKTAAVVSFVAAPAVLPAIWIGDAWAKRSKNKESLQEMEMSFGAQRTRWENDKSKKRAEAKFYEDATEIANIYRALIATVQMAIKETILPELTGIDAFLVADAIKNCIISDMNPEEAEIAEISVYQGSAYDMHYMFVRNAFDYYTTIVAFFTEPILTKIVADDKVTVAERKAFDMKVSQIKKQTQMLEEASMFGGAV